MTTFLKFVETASAASVSVLLSDLASEPEELLHLLSAVGARGSAFATEVMAGSGSRSRNSRPLSSFIGRQAHWVGPSPLRCDIAKRMLEMKSSVTAQDLGRATKYDGSGDILRVLLENRPPQVPLPVIGDDTTNTAIEVLVAHGASLDELTPFAAGNNTLWGHWHSRWHATARPKDRLHIQFRLQLLLPYVIDGRIDPRAPVQGECDCELFQDQLPQVSTGWHYGTDFQAALQTCLDEVFPTVLARIVRTYVRYSA